MAANNIRTVNANKARIVNLNCDIETLSVCRFYDFKHDISDVKVEKPDIAFKKRFLKEMEERLVNGNYLSKPFTNANLNRKVKYHLNYLDKFIGFSQSKNRVSIEKILNKIFNFNTTPTDAYRKKIKFMIIYAIMTIYQQNISYKNIVMNNNNKNKKFFMLNQNLGNGAVQEFLSRIQLCSENLDSCLVNKQNTIHSIFMTSTKADPSHQAQLINHKESLNTSKNKTVKYKVLDSKNKPVYDITVEIEERQPKKFKVVAYKMNGDKGVEWEFKTGRNTEMTKKSVMSKIISNIDLDGSHKESIDKIFSLLLQKHIGDFFQGIESKFYKIPIWTGDKLFQRILFAIGSPCIAQSSNSNLEFINMDVYNKRDEIKNRVLDYVKYFREKPQIYWKAMINGLNKLINTNFEVNIDNYNNSNSYQSTRPSNVILAIPAFLPIFINNAYKPQRVLIVSHDERENGIINIAPSAIIFLNDDPMAVLSTEIDNKARSDIKGFLIGQTKGDGKTLRLTNSKMIGKNLESKIIYLGKQINQKSRPTPINGGIIYTNPSFTKNYPQPQIYPLTGINENSLKHMKVFNSSVKKLHSYSQRNVVQQSSNVNPNRFKEIQKKITNYMNSKHKSKASFNLPRNVKRPKPNNTPPPSPAKTPYTSREASPQPGLSKNNV
tara:strand:- start:4170 stop:6158 length:1989 start_codon:yes stop_codon:yes gene_type:complete